VDIDFIFNDESESVVSQLNTEIIKYPRDCYYRFLQSCSKSKKVIISDANADVRSFRLAQIISEFDFSNFDNDITDDDRKKIEKLKKLPLLDKGLYFDKLVDILNNSNTKTGKQVILDFIKENTILNDKDDGRSATMSWRSHDVGSAHTSSGLRPDDQVKKNKKIGLLYCTKGSFSHHVYVITTSQLIFWQKLILSISKGETFIYITNSATMAEMIHEYLTYNCQIPKEKVLLITADTKKSGQFSDINEEWKKFPYIIFSPVLTCGVSYDVLSHDLVFGYFKDGSCDALQCCQMLDRPRKLKKNLFIIYIEDNYDADSMQYIIDEEKLHEWLIEEEGNYVKQFGKELMEKIICANSYHNLKGKRIFSKRDSLYELSLDEQVVKNKSKNNLLGEMIYLLMQNDPKEMRLIKETDRKVSEEEREAFYRLMNILKQQIFEKHVQMILSAGKTISYKNYKKLLEKKFRTDEELKLLKRFKLAKFYNLSEIQLDDKDTVMQSLTGVHNGLPQMIEILQIMVKGTLNQKIDEFLNDLKSYYSDNNQFISYTNRKLEGKVIEKYLIDIVDFLLELSKSMGFNGPCDPAELPKEKIENFLINNVKNGILLTKLNKIRKSARLERTDKKNSVCEKGQFNQYTINTFLKLGGLRLIRCGTGNKKRKLLWTGHVNDNFEFKKSKKKWQEIPEKYIKKIESTKYTIVCFYCFRKNVTVGESWSTKTRYDTCINIE
jgi:hypothetical protein